ncbi:MAG: hypothetical protein JSS07_07420 [Proteobacteria bacterium]|nr:hypothetical protein [Pseudomonadota bacterium]
MRNLDLAENKLVHGGLGISTKAVEGLLNGMVILLTGSLAGGTAGYMVGATCAYGAPTIMGYSVAGGFGLVIGLSVFQSIGSIHLD